MDYQKIADYYIKKREKYNLIMSILVFVVLVIFILSIWNTLFFLFMFLIIPFTIIIWIKMSNLKVMYKKDYVETIFYNSFSEVTYDEHKQYINSVFDQYHIFKHTEFLYIEDIISGKFNRQPFISMEVHSNQSHIRDNFIPSRIYKFPMMTHIESPVYIFPTNYHLIKPDIDLHKINIESIAFNRQFDIFAKNDHDAFQVVDSNMIDKLLKAFNDINLRMMVVTQDEMVILIDNIVDAFEVNLYKDNTHIIDEIGDEITRTIILIDTFIKKSTL